MATQGSNQAKLEIAKGNVDFDADVFKIILMASGFTYNRVSHGEYADVSANELPTAFGYTVGGNTLAGVTIVQDDVNNKGKVTWNNTTWTASGGSIVTSGAIIFDDTHADDVIIGYIDFISDQTTLDGGVYTIAQIEVDIL